MFDPERIKAEFEDNIARREFLHKLFRLDKTIITQIISTVDDWSFSSSKARSVLEEFVRAHHPVVYKVKKMCHWGRANPSLVKDLGYLSLFMMRGLDFTSLMVPTSNHDWTMECHRVYRGRRLACSAMQFDIQVVDCDCSDDPPSVVDETEDKCFSQLLAAACANSPVVCGRSLFSSLVRPLASS